MDFGDLFNACMNPQQLFTSSMDEQTKSAISKCCSESLEEASKDELVSGSGELLPEYEGLLRDGGYDDEEDMCNGEGINASDIYDDEEKEYGDEFERGFNDCVKAGGFYLSGDDDFNEAYQSGLEHAQELMDLLDT